MRPKFTEDQFTPMQEWYTAKDKAKLANDFVRFVLADFSYKLFTKTLYQHLSHMWGHIAHYNRGGFYDTWFRTDTKRLAFLKRCLTHPVYGDATYTRCDVERILSNWIKENGVVETLYAVVVKCTKEQEKSELHRLAAKYPKEVYAN